jgi:hypothetical protein
MDAYPLPGMYREDDAALRKDLTRIERMFFNAITMGFAEHSQTLYVSWAELQTRLGPALQAGYLISLETMEYALSICQSIAVLASSLAHGGAEANKGFLAFSDDVGRISEAPAGSSSRPRTSAFPQSPSLFSVHGELSPSVSSDAGSPYSDSSAACYGRLIGPVRASGSRPSQVHSYSPLFSRSTSRLSSESCRMSSTLRFSSPENVEVTYDHWRLWFLDHFDHPYPDNMQKAYLLSKVPSLSKSQVCCIYSLPVSDSV